ncbi:type VII toxin-antitoxin system HepT family RNase toxin [Piscibacillus sp. B03]|uniref:type VII toxin-antitoxin system HepT family RNase toxin n=1 Tax=Piscibacillus sp. B03 TaxID=3457430 RepID=UPI003FCD81F9
MYFVDRDHIEQTLLYMNGLLETYEQQTSESFLEKLGTERLAQMVVESIIDVGNMMIDGFIMRDPGSYEDIIDILVDEQVIPKEDETAYKETIGLRKMLVREYTNVNHKEIEEVLSKHVKTLEHFRPYVLDYLEKEMGPVTTFKKREEK